MEGSLRLCVALRRDGNLELHILFDLGLIAIDPVGMNVLVSPSLYSTTYAWLAGKSLRLPEEEAYKPSVESLRQHRAWTGL